MNAKQTMLAVAAGDRSALEELYLQYRNLVFAVALSVLRTKAEAEDVTADVFVSVMQHADAYRGGSLKSYLAAIARNAAINRKEKRYREVFSDFAEDETFLGLTEEEDFSMTLTLKAALQVLDEQEREVALLYAAGLKHREIAAVLKIPPGTARWRYKRAIDALKGYFGKGGSV